MAKEETHPLYNYIYHEIITPKKDWSIRARKPFTLKILEILQPWGMPTNPNLQPRLTAKIPPWKPLENTIHLDLLTPMTK